MLVSGDTVGRWMVEEVVSAGSPALFLCSDTRAERKALLRAAPADEPQAEGLRREAAALRVLDHPALPRMLDHGEGRTEAGSLAWIATEPFHGETLADRLLSGPLEWREACRVFHALAGALAHAHAHSVIHRDVGPEKILLGADSAAVLAGFDLALDETRLEQVGTLPRGDLAYAPPEVVSGAELHGARADVYALGVTLYEALTGRKAFPAAFWAGAGSPADRAQEWRAKGRALDPGDAVPSWLGQLVRKATDPAPERRLPDMDAFVGWLDAAEASWKRHETAEVRRPPTPVPVVPMVMPAPSLAPTWDPVATSRSTELLLHLAAAVLGMVAAMAFSALLILFAEMSG